MQEEQVKLTGYIRFDLFDQDGKLKQHEEVKNVVVSVGKNFLVTWLTAASQAGKFMSWIGLGTGSTAATTSDVALQTELSTRVDGTLSPIVNVWQNQAIFIAGVNTGAITESGIFSASSSGTMLARQVFPVINKNSSDILQVTWQITIS